MIYKKNNLKIFLGLVNYGTQAGLIAREVRKIGFNAISVAHPDRFKRLIDVELRHGGNFFQKIRNHLWNYFLLIKCFFKYDIFHFFFGKTLFPMQLDLPLYKLFGKKVIMEYLGYDVQLYEKSVKKYKITNVKYYYSKDLSLKKDKIKKKRLKWESKFVSKQLVCAPYLSEFVPGSEVLPLAIDLNEYKYSQLEMNTNYIKIMHAPTHTGNKGTVYIEKAINRLIKEGYKILYMRIQNVPHSELKKKYYECDIFVDQVVGGWYGTAAIEAMAVGRPTVCFIRKSYFKYIDYGEKIPIINANPQNLYSILKHYINNKDLLPEFGIKSRKFVEEIHDVEKITNKMIQIYFS